MGHPKVLIVEDHPLMVDALCASLRELIPTVVFVHAGSVAQGLLQLQLHPSIDLLLLDLNLPDAQGIQTLRWFCDARPQGALLVFSVIDDTDIREACMRNRVAFLSKSEPVTRLIDQVLQVLQDASRQSAVTDTTAVCVAQEPEPEGIHRLSERQLHVLSQLARGKRSREIAVSLGIEESTVRTHQNHIYQRLGVKNKTQASALYWRWTHQLGRRFEDAGSRRDMAD